MLKPSAKRRRNKEEMIQFRAEERDKAIAIENKNAMIAAKE